MARLWGAFSHLHSVAQSRAPWNPRGRKGWDLMLAGARLFLLLQAGIAAGFAFLIANTKLQIEYLHVKWSVLGLALIGLLSGRLARVVIQRSVKYHNDVSDRGLTLERDYGGNLLPSLRKTWDSGVAGLDITKYLFLLISAMMWGVA